MEKLIPFHEAVLRFGVRVQTGRNWLNLRKFPIPTYKVGRLRFVKESEMDAYFSSLPTDSSPIADQAPHLSLVEDTETGHFGLTHRKRGRPSRNMGTVEEKMVANKPTSPISSGNY